MPSWVTSNAGPDDDDAHLALHFIDFGYEKHGDRPECLSRLLFYQQASHSLLVSVAAKLLREWNGLGPSRVKFLEEVEQRHQAVWMKSAHDVVQRALVEIGHWHATSTLDPAMSPEDLVSVLQPLPLLKLNTP
jgi:hypothetical protein